MKVRDEMYIARLNSRMGVRTLSLSRDWIIPPLPVPGRGRQPCRGLPGRQTGRQAVNATPYSRRSDHTLTWAYTR